MIFNVQIRRYLVRYLVICCFVLFHSTYLCSSRISVNPNSTYQFSRKPIPIVIFHAQIRRYSVTLVFVFSTLLSSKLRVALIFWSKLYYSFHAMRSSVDAGTLICDTFCVASRRENPSCVVRLLLVIFPTPRIYSRDFASARPRPDICSASSALA